MNYYPFHIGDYVSATRHLSWSEDMAYRRLLDTYYTTEKPLPADLRACCRLVLATTDEQREAVQIVLDEFFTLTENGWVNARADDEIQAMRDKQQKQRDKANKRWHKPTTDTGNAPAMPRHTSSDAVASKSDADAMPPTPTPTPTPTPDISPVGDMGADKPRKPATKPAPLPADFYPNETGVEYAEKRNVTLAVEFESFRNWHQAKGTTMKDWQAAWRTWCDKAVEFGRAGVTANGARASPQFDARSQDRKRAIAEMTGKTHEPRIIEREINPALRLAAAGVG